MNTTFSIIIPFYNAESTLQYCLESVSAQTIDNFELIAVNDGSTDNSINIYNEWKERHPQIKAQLIQQENSGLGKSRNRAIDKSSAEIICLLDADDCWEADKLEIIESTFRDESSVKALYHSVKTIGLDKSGKRNVYQIKEMKDLLLKGNPIVPSAFCMKRELFQQYKFSEDPDFHGAEDLELWMRLILDDVIPTCLNQCLATYREEGGMSSRLAEHLDNVFKVLEKFYKEGHYDLEILARAKRRKYLEAARFHQKRKDFRLAENYYSAADFKSMKVAGLRFLNFLGISL